jgi:hypothetical protein
MRETMFQPWKAWLMLLNLTGVSESIEISERKAESSEMVESDSSWSWHTLPDLWQRDDQSLSGHTFLILWINILPKNLSSSIIQPYKFDNSESVQLKKRKRTKKISGKQIFWKCFIYKMPEIFSHEFHLRKNREKKARESFHFFIMDFECIYKLGLRAPSADCLSTLFNTVCWQGFIYQLRRFWLHIILTCATLLIISRNPDLDEEHR